MKLSKFNGIYSEEEFTAICAAAYAAIFRRYKAPQSILNVLLHYVGELGELSQCPRKGRGFEIMDQAKEFVNRKPMLVPSSMPIPNQLYINRYDKFVKGTIGDELADCFLVMAVLIQRLHIGMDAEIILHNKVSFLNWEDDEFDNMLRWAIEAGVGCIWPIMEELKIDETYLVMSRLMCLSNNIQYLAQFWGIDLKPFIQAKQFYNEIRNK